MRIEVKYMNDNLKVLQICSYYIGTKLYNKLFTSLSVFEVDQRVYVFVSKLYEIDNPVNYRIDVSHCYNSFDRLFFNIKHSKVLKDIESKYKIEKFNIMHAHSLFSNGYIAYKLNQRYNIPYVVAVRNTDVNLFFKRMIHLRKIGIEILKNANKIIFISEPYKTHTIKTYVPKDCQDEIIKKSIVIPNGIDEFWLMNKNNGRKDTLKKKEIKLIYVGSIDRNKKYKKIILRYNFINYVPFCEKEELINYYRQNDIFVMPSKYETFGLVYAEAMSQGLPIIYTRGQGFDGQFKNGEVGYSVKCDSVEEITENIVKIHENYCEISKNCLENVDKFDWRNIALQYNKIYNDICRMNKN